MYLGHNLSPGCQICNHICYTETKKTSPLALICLHISFSASCFIPPLPLNHHRVYYYFYKRRLMDLKWAQVILHCSESLQVVPAINS